MKLTGEQLDAIENDLHEMAIAPTKNEAIGIQALISHAKATIGKPDSELIQNEPRIAQGGPMLHMKEDGTVEIIKESTSRSEIAMHVHAGFATKVPPFKKVFDSDEERLQWERDVAKTSVRWTDNLIAELKRTEPK